MERDNDLAPAFSPRHARPHESIRWALTARSLRADTLPQRGTPKESLMLMSMTEALITITVGELLRMIELDLKDRLERFLRSGHRHAWWMQLDTRVRRNAENRRKWTVAEIGTRRVARLESTDWLSMGDVLRCLRNLAPLDWKACLDAENGQIQAFDRQLRRIKSFRDYRVAHPKPRPSSTAELAAICRSIEMIPQVIRSLEWQAATGFLGVIASQDSDARSSLHSRASGYSFPFAMLWKMLQCPTLEHEDRCRCEHRLDARTARWRAHILKWSAAADAGGRVFFGAPYETDR